MFHSIELQIIQFIQQFRNPVFDAFFKFLDFFDRQEFLFVLIPALWLGRSWKAGLRLFYMLFLSMITNHVLKAFFASPRPFHIDPNIGIIKVHDYGFPSGAAQTVILLSGILLIHWKSRWKWHVAFLYTFFISFSRGYLAVHFPTDIIAGWLVGFILWIFYTSVRPLIEKELEKLKIVPLFLLSQAIPLLLLFWQYSPSIIRISGCAMGMGLGLFINNLSNWFLPLPSTKKESILRIFIGIIGTFFCYFMISNLPIPLFPLTIFFQFSLLGLCMATGSLLVYRKFAPID